MINWRYPKLILPYLQVLGTDVGMSALLANIIFNEAPKNFLFVKPNHSNVLRQVGVWLVRKFLLAHISIAWAVPSGRWHIYPLLGKKLVVNGGYPRKYSIDNIGSRLTKATSYPRLHWDLVSERDVRQIGWSVMDLEIFRKSSRLLGSCRVVGKIFRSQKVKALSRWIGNRCRKRWMLGVSF